MPDFRLSDDDALALTVALMSHANTRIPSSDYLVAGKPKADFNPPDEFGDLMRRYRCLSCHSIRDGGDRLASDLTCEGSRVNHTWLQHYLTTPYSMRRTLTIAMPIFHFPDQEARFMADYMSQVLVDTRIGNDWERNRDRADAQNGKALFDAKGCLACHQLHGTGGDVGPSLTTQVPDFPQGTWVGDKLRGNWIYQWLLNPQSLLPETLEPNVGLTDQEALDLTAYLLALQNPDFQEQEK
jgi:cytochrome c2